MKNVSKLLLTLSLAFFASVALTACDDDDATASGSTFSLSNN